MICCNQRTLQQRILNRRSIPSRQAMYVVLWNFKHAMHDLWTWKRLDAEEKNNESEQHLFEELWSKYRVAQKWHSFLYALPSSNINRFSQLFHCQNQEKICKNTITKDPTTPQVCRYTTLCNIKCLKNNNWKQDDFCNNTFLRNYQGTTCLLSLLIFDDVKAYQKTVPFLGHPVQDTR